MKRKTASTKKKKSDPNDSPWEMGGGTWVTAEEKGGEEPLRGAMNVGS